MSENCKHLTQYTFLKSGVSNYDLSYMPPKLLIIFAFVSNFCHLNDIKFVVTSIYRPPNDGISTSKTHQEVRAFDVSLKNIYGWNSDHINALKVMVDSNFKHFGAISKASGESRPIVIHDTGSGLHAHIQIKPNLK